MRRPTRWTLVGLIAFVLPVVVLLALSNAPVARITKGALLERVMLGALGRQHVGKASPAASASPTLSWTKEPLPSDVRALPAGPLPTASSDAADAHVITVPPPPRSPAVVLYDQYNNGAATATLSATFTDFATFSSDTADDFVVPGGQTWNVQSVDADGVYFNGVGPAASFNVFFYSNSGTLPGAPVFSATNQPFTQAGTTFTVNLAVPAVLPAGTYWVEMQANMTFNPNGEWGWTDRTVQSNQGAAWQNPGGGFGVCPAWIRKTTCVPTAGGPDQVFRLNGTIGAPAGVLYDQYNNGAATATLSATFTDFTTFSSDLGDDFVVPAGETWNVQSVDADGVYFNGAGPAASFNVFFYSNSGTLPGAPVFSATNQPFTQVGTTFTVNLAVPAVLPAGTYWVEMQANMTFNPNGEWGWTDRTVQSNQGAAWQNPGGGFGVCPAWIRKTTCVPTAGGPDQVFRLNGTTSGTPSPTPTPTPTNTPTSTPTPTNTPTNTPTRTPTPIPGSLTGLSPAKLWVGLANSDDVGIRFDLRAIVYENGAQVGSGHLDSVAGGSSAFNNAKLNVIPLTLASPVPVSSGQTFAVEVSARNACAGSGKNSGRARLWYNGQPIDSGATRDAGSRFDATINGSTSDYFLRTGFALSTAAGSARTFQDVAAGPKCGPFVSFGTWTMTLP